MQSKIFALLLLSFAAVCFAQGRGGGGGGGGNPQSSSSDDGTVDIATVCPSCPPRPDADPSCEIKGNGNRGSNGNEDKVWLCHGTASETNPYVLINVDDASLWEGHFSSDGGPGHGKNNHPDIWPNSIGYDGLFYDCNCERPATEEEVLTVVVAAQDATTDEDTGVDLFINLQSTHEGTTYTITVSGLPEQSGLDNGTPVPGAPEGSMWSFTEAGLTGLGFNPPANFWTHLDASDDSTGTPIVANVVVTASAPSRADPSVTLTAEVGATFNIRIEAVNDAPHATISSSSATNFHGFATDVPVPSIPKGQYEPLSYVYVTVSVERGKLSFYNGADLTLPDSTSVDGWSANPVHIGAGPDNVGGKLKDATFFNKLQFRLDNEDAPFPAGLQFHSLEDFAGDAPITIKISDGGSVGKCPQDGSTCGTTILTFTPTVVCVGTPEVPPNTVVMSSFDIEKELANIYAKKNNNGGKMAVCHGTNSDTNPYVFLSVDDSAYYGHFEGGHAAETNGKQRYPDLFLGQSSSGDRPNGGGTYDWTASCTCNVNFLDDVIEEITISSEGGNLVISDSASSNGEAAGLRLAAQDEEGVVLPQQDILVPLLAVGGVVVVVTIGSAMYVVHTLKKTRSHQDTVEAPILEGDSDAVKRMAWGSRLAVQQTASREGLMRNAAQGEEIEAEEFEDMSDEELDHTSSLIDAVKGIEEAAPTLRPMRSLPEL